MLAAYIANNIRLNLEIENKIKKASMSLWKLRVLCHHNEILDQIYKVGVENV